MHQQLQSKEKKRVETYEMLYNRDNGTGGKERALWASQDRADTLRETWGFRDETAFLKLPNNQQVHFDGRVAYTVPQGR